MRNYILVAITSICLQYGNGQSFEFVENNPFNMQVAGPQIASNVALKYIFHDSDSDGDMDLTVAGLGQNSTNSVSLLHNLRYFIGYQENVGSKSSPAFSDRESIYDSFQLPTGVSFMIPSGGDLNSDGLIDFVVSAETDTYNVQYLEFRLQNPDGSFTVTNCKDWNLDPFPPYSFFIPEVTDLDSDGDLDILLEGYRRSYEEDGNPVDIPAFLYAKNIGTPASPQFAGWYRDPYELTPDSGAFASGDLDLDGDIDLLNVTLIDEIATFSFIENNGTGKPSYADPVYSPFDLPIASETEDFMFPSLVDIDNDGDLDLFFAVQSTDKPVELRYYRNTLLSSNEDLLSLQELLLYPIPNNDGIVYISKDFQEPIQSINVFDEAGRLVLPVLHTGVKFIDLSSFDQGVYFIEFDLDNFKIVKKVILVD